MIPNLAEIFLLECMTFKHDGILHNISRCGKNYMRTSFGDGSLLSRHFFHVWPPSSPDVCPYDFWIRGLQVANLPRSTDINIDAKTQLSTTLSYLHFRYAVQCCEQYCPSTVAVVEG